jgi:hypothetical protein
VSWIGKKPTLYVIRNPLYFGCDAYAYVHVRRNKLGNKEENGIFIGSKYGVRDNRVWNPIKEFWMIHFVGRVDVPFCVIHKIDCVTNINKYKLV